MRAPLQSWLEFSDGRRFDLVGTATLGRAPENSLVLADNEISRKHAIIQMQGEGEFWLVDLGSANGTYVNDRRIAQPVQLHRGDQIRLSGVYLEFHSEMLTSAHPIGRQMMASTMLSIKQTDCWLMVADIVGSTRLSQELAPEELPRITGGWFKTCRQVIEDCGGHMSKYLGDGFFCYWEGAPGSEILLQDALSRLSEMQTRSSPPFRVVLHRGSAVLGSVPTMSEVNLHGPEVNFTFRIEKVAGMLKLPIMLSENAHRSLGMDTVTVGEHIVDGFSGRRTFYAPR